jgi:hypothetical protein
MDNNFLDTILLLIDEIYQIGSKTEEDSDIYLKISLVEGFI